MTPQEAQAFQEQQAARTTARAKFSDGTQQIETADLQYFEGDEITALANAGRLVHMAIGPDRHRHNRRRR